MLAIKTSNGLKSPLAGKASNGNVECFDPRILHDTNENISGVDSLNVTIGKIKSTNEVEVNGVTSQASTPTPTNPVDIYCNNGALKARHQSGLPTGYTLLEYIRSGGTHYIDLGYKGNGNTKVDVKFKYYTSTSATGSGRAFGSRTTSTNNAFAIGTASGIVYATEANNVFWCYDGQPYFVDDTEFGLNVWKTVVFSATEHTIDGVSVGDDYDIETFETPRNLKLFGFDNGGSMGFGYVDIAYCKLWNNGVLVRDLVPSKNASNVVGMYDLVSGQFLTNAGTGDFTAGDPVSDPVEVYADGTPEAVTVGLDVYDPSTMGTAEYVTLIRANTMGLEYVLPGGSNSFCIPVEENTDYSIGFTTAPSGGSIFRAATTSTMVNERTSPVVPIAYDLDFNLYGTKVINSGSGAHYLYVQVATSVFSTAKPTLFVRALQSATPTDLLQVNNAKDSQEFVSKVVTRNCIALVLTGDETWQKSPAVNAHAMQVWITPYGGTPDRLPLLSTHFVGSDATNTEMPDHSIKLSNSSLFSGNACIIIKENSCNTTLAFKAFLADKLAAGTPIIVIIPLPDPATESVESDTLRLHDGTNIVAASSNYISGQTIEIGWNELKIV